MVRSRAVRTSTSSRTVGIDLFSSAKGPGLLGLLMASLVVAGLGFLLFLGDDQGPARDSDKVIREQAGTIHSLEDQLEDLHSRAKAAEGRARRAEQVLGERDRAQERMRSLEREVGELQDAVALRSAAMQLLEERARAVGERIPVLQTTDGETYRDAEILRIDAAGILFLVDVSTGPERVWLQSDLLQPSVRERFGLDEADKGEQLAQLKAELHRLDKERQELVGEWQVVRQIRDLQEKIRADTRQIVELENEVEEAAKRVVELEAEAKDRRRQHKRALSARRPSAHLAAAQQAENQARRLARENVVRRTQISELRERLDQSRRDLEDKEALVKDPQRKQELGRQTIQTLRPDRIAKDAALSAEALRKTIEGVKEDIGSVKEKLARLRKGEAEEAK